MTANLIKLLFRKVGKVISVTNQNGTYKSYAVITPLANSKAGVGSLSFEQNGFVDSTLYEVLAPAVSPVLMRDDVISSKDDCYVVETAEIIYLGDIPCYIKATARKYDNSSNIIS